MPETEGAEKYPGAPRKAFRGWDHQPCLLGASILQFSRTCLPWLHELRRLKAPQSCLSSRYWDKVPYMILLKQLKYSRECYLNAFSKPHFQHFYIKRNESNCWNNNEKVFLVVHKRGTIIRLRKNPLILWIGVISKEFMVDNLWNYCSKIWSILFSKPSWVW